MITLKFGGTSMKSPEMITKVGKIIRSTQKSGRKPIVVVSAMSGVTNQLLEASRIVIRNEESDEKKKIIDQLRYNHIEAAKELILDEYVLRKTIENINNKLSHFSDFLDALGIIGEISTLSHDEIISLGEKLSANLLSAHLKSIGVSSEYVDLSKILRGNLKDTDEDFFDNVENEIKLAVQPIIDSDSVPVLTGFFGKIPGGIVDTMGRGYSDFTAALSGAAFHTKEIQIWTDVDGLLSADPRRIPSACVLPEVSYDEAGELAQFGAKVLHPQTVWPAVKKCIPVRIKNTMKPEALGTLITREGAQGKYLCKSIASKKRVTAITITSSKMLMAVGFLAKVFHIFASNNVSIDLVATGEISITVTINGITDKVLQKISVELSHFSKIDVLKNQAIICAVGMELRHRQGSVAKILNALGDAGISVHAISQSAQKINMSFLLDEDHTEKAMKALHQVIFEKQG